MSQGSGSSLGLQVRTVSSRGRHRRDAGEAWATDHSNGDGRGGRPDGERERFQREGTRREKRRQRGQEVGAQTAESSCRAVPRDSPTGDGA